MSSGMSFSVAIIMRILPIEADFLREMDCVGGDNKK